MKISFCRFDRLVGAAFACMLCYVRLQAAQSSPAKLEDLFILPPAESRILKIIHNWPDSPDSQTNLIRSLQEKGFGGVVCNVSFDDYLVSDKKWAALENAVRAARQTGMTLWLYDERGYPSGNAGGLVLKNHPEWQARGLLVADKKVQEGTVALEIPPGKPVWIGALPISNGIARIDSTTNLAACVINGRLNWQAPKGSWHVLAMTDSPLFEGTHAALNLADKMPYINLLQAEPTARFIELTHQRYAEHFGTDLGRTFASTFTDEPSLMSLFLRAMPYRVLPWSENLKVSFEKSSGKPLTETLPSLVANTGPSGQAVRYVFWQAVGNLVSQNFFGQIQDWCGKHKILSGGHLLMEEDLAGHAGLYGNFFQCLRRLDAPSIDCLTSLPGDVPWQIARLAASAAELEGKTVVMCETSDHSQVWRPKGDTRPKRIVSELEIRGTINRLVVSGVNVITSYYSYEGLDGAAMNRLNLYTGRICAFLQGGHQASDIALVYPTESLWTRHVPARSGSTDSATIGAIELAYRTSSEALFKAGREFTYADSRALQDARLENGVLIHGNLRWRAVLLPGADTLPLKVWQKLERFVQEGGILACIGNPPRNSESEFPSEPVKALSTTLFGNLADDAAIKTNAAGGAGIFLPQHMASSIPTVLNALLEPAAQTPSHGAPLRCTHRTMENHEVFFVVNDSSSPWKGPLNLCGEGEGQSWNPVTGEAKKLPSGQNISLELEPWAGMLFTFSKARLPARLSPRAGILPSSATRSLPAVKPIVSGGEFVRCELTEGKRSETSAAWRARGTIRKSNVDTFLFSTLSYPSPQDLSKDDSISFRVVIPEGQSAPARLLLIIHEDQGGDFLASTALSLAGDGVHAVVVPFEQFQLAGWSSDKDGRLDLSKVREIRIGWGGYYGTEGETIQFDFDIPSVLSQNGKDSRK